MADELDPKFSLLDHLNGILNQIRATFEQNNVSLPSRQYISVNSEGDTAHDCEQLTVSLSQVYSGGPGNQEQFPQGCGGPKSAVVVVELVRAIPALGGGGATRGRGQNPNATPTPEQETEMAEIQLVDAWLLNEAALAFADNQIPDAPTGYYLGAIADVTAGPKSGAYQAVVATIIAGVV